jgi:hypothetical protein
VRAVLALVPTANGPRALDDGGTAGRPVRMFEEALIEVRKE